MSEKFKLNRFARGFSLVEMAIVLVILGFVIGALLLPLQAQRTQLFQSQTENTLEVTKRALLGYAQSQSRLPCPAISTSHGAESLTAGACTQQIGFLPAVTLGVQPIDSDGFALDAWNNRILYAVTQVNTSGGAVTPDFTTTNEMANVGVASLAPDLRVCATSTAATCSATINLINNAVAVIYSLGATGTKASNGEDEKENLNAIANLDTVFVSREPTVIQDRTDEDQVKKEFDDVVIWISPYVLYNAMIEAGQLH